MSSFMTGTGIERVPKEELQFRKQAAGIPWWNSFQPEPEASKEARNKYFDQYPAASGVPKTLEKAASPYFWNMYYGLPPKSDVVDDESVQAVLEAEDRDALDVKVWTNAVEVLERFYLLHPQTPEQKKANETAKGAHKAIVAQVNAAYPGFSELQDAYYALPEDGQARKDFKYRNPRLEKGWELKHNLENADPLLSKYYGAGAGTPTSSTGLPVGTPTAGLTSGVGAGFPGASGIGQPYSGGPTSYGLYPVSGHWPGYGNVEVAAQRVAAGEGIFRHAQPRTLYGGEWRPPPAPRGQYIPIYQGGGAHIYSGGDIIRPQAPLPAPNLWAYTPRRRG